VVPVPMSKTQIQTDHITIEVTGIPELYIEGASVCSNLDFRLRLHKITMIISAIRSRPPRMPPTTVPVGGPFRLLSEEGF